MDTALRERIRTLPDGLHRLRLADGRAVVAKRRREAPAGFFAMEAHGLALLRAAVDDYRQTTVMVTHDPVAASWADRVVFLADGRIVDIVAAQPADRIADRMTRLGSWA